MSYKIQELNFDIVLIDALGIFLLTPLKKVGGGGSGGGRPLTVSIRFARPGKSVVFAAVIPWLYTTDVSG